MLGNWVRAPAKRWIDGEGYRIDIWGSQTLPAEAKEEASHRDGVGQWYRQMKTEESQSPSREHVIMRVLSGLPWLLSD